MTPILGGSARAVAGVVGPSAPPTPALTGPWSCDAVDAGSPEAALVARWMRSPHVADWWGQAWTDDAWDAELAAQGAADHSRPFLLRFGRHPLAYVEVYRVARDVLGAVVDAGAADLGIHLAIGEAAATGRGMGRATLDAVAAGLLRVDRACSAVWGDPAADHVAARRAFTAAGFALVGEVELPHKRAAALRRRR